MESNLARLLTVSLQPLVIMFNKQLQRKEPVNKSTSSHHSKHCTGRFCYSEEDQIWEAVKKNLQRQVFTSEKNQQPMTDKTGSGVRPKRDRTRIKVRM